LTQRNPETLEISLTESLGGFNFNYCKSSKLISVTTIEVEMVIKG